MASRGFLLLGIVAAVAAAAFVGSVADMPQAPAPAPQLKIEPTQIVCRFYDRRTHWRTLDLTVAKCLEEPLGEAHLHIALTTALARGDLPTGGDTPYLRKPMLRALQRPDAQTALDAAVKAVPDYSETVYVSRISSETARWNADRALSLARRDVPVTASVKSFERLVTILIIVVGMGTLPRVAARVAGVRT